MNLAALHHSTQGAYCYPIGTHQLRVVVKTAVLDVENITVLWRDRFAATDATLEQGKLTRVGTDGTSDYWAGTLSNETRRFWYVFCIEFKKKVVWLGEDGVSPRKIDSAGFQYAYINTPDIQKQPDWLLGTTFYQIFPDRFANGDLSNDPQPKLPWGDLPKDPIHQAGGDLDGIRLKADYLAHLGIGAIYTTPLFYSKSNHKYDTSDYYRVDPAFGSNDDLKDLVSTLHTQGIKFILDGVFNHSGREFFAFKDVLEKGEKSPYVSWFHNIHSFPVKPDALNYETFSTDIPDMPKLNTANEECATYLLDMVKHWTATAKLDGWRLDVADEVDYVFWRRFRQVVKKENPEAWILGEVWHDATAWLRGDQFDSVMDYPWRSIVLQYLQGRIDALEFDRNLTKLWYRYPAPVLSGLLHLLGSHDTARVKTEVGEKKAGLAAVLLLTSPGVPLVYYGDEIGIEGGNDPDCRRCMEWNEKKWDTSLLQTYQRLIAFRKDRPWLNDGAWNTLVADPKTNVYMYERTNERMLGGLPLEEEKDRALVIINPERFPVQCTVPSLEVEGEYWDVVTQQATVLKSGALISLPPYSAQVFIEKRI